jgi:hypothetical protein
MSLKEFCGEGWMLVEPPLRSDDESVVARRDGQPIKVGFLTERLKDSKDEFHARYRSGQYDITVNIDFEVGRGKVKVERADGYSH